MLVVLSPAKTLATPEDYSVGRVTVPRLHEKAWELVKELQSYSVEELQALMGVSEQLGRLNHERYQTFSRDPKGPGAVPALVAFRGDVYKPFVDGMSRDDYAASQKMLRILSGLYGVLRPLDLMQPYRLEMGTRFFAGPHKKGGLYDYWRHDVTTTLQKDISALGASVVLNLASKEYSKSIDVVSLSVPFVTVHFKEHRNGRLRVIALNVKRARGAMARWIVDGRVRTINELVQFDGDGYRFDSSLSSERELVFCR